MENKSCFFIGHREASNDIMPILEQVIEKLISQYGVTHFVVGGYGGFDRLASGGVISAKKRHPQIMLTLLLPYHPAERPVKLPPGFDNTYYPLGMEAVPRRFAIVRANRHMVDQSDFLIAYVYHPASNARNLLEYAERRAKQGYLHVINIANISSASDDF